MSYIKMWRNRESAEIREEKLIKKEAKEEKKRLEKEKKEQRREERRLRKQEKKAKNKIEIKEESIKDFSEILHDNSILKQKKIICFDLYGTLIYRPHAHEKLKHNLKGIWIVPFKKYYNVIQTTRKENVDSAYESVSGFKMPDRAIRALQKHFAEEVANTEIFPESLEVLKKLKINWYKLALISNLSQEFEEPLRKLIPWDTFDYEALSYDVWTMKPDGVIFNKILDDANAGRTSTHYNMDDMIMVWDGKKNDVDWAKNVWMDAILLNRKLEKSSYDKENNLIIIHTLTDLLDILWIDY